MKRTEPVTYRPLSSFAGDLCRFMVERRERAIRALLEEVFTATSVEWGATHRAQLVAACKVLDVIIRERREKDGEYLTIVRSGVELRTIHLPVFSLLPIS